MQAAIVQNEPVISVGILAAAEIRFRLRGVFTSTQQTTLSDTDEVVSLKEGKLTWRDGLFTELLFAPENEAEGIFTLADVSIGIRFHWERKEEQSFRGSLRFIATGEGVQAINLINVESYLKSVIASEMNGNAPKAFLKAHAVISRGWLLAQIEKKNEAPHKKATPCHCREKEENTHIKWYDREDHSLFDVCADDHCQRYQGITRALSPQVIEAIEETRGEVLIYADRVCDTRFSKCCGGLTEEFQYCWEAREHPYMPSIADGLSAPVTLSSEAEAEAFILSRPKAFCSNPPKDVLRQVLNDYDCETTDFYRWQQVYTQTELSELLLKKSGIDFGKVKTITPLKRGKSGRIYELKIEGSRHTAVFGKELEIRRVLSGSHLYSSAFTVTAGNPDNDGFPQQFTLCGAGWGHGVGLCQIGAAVMGSSGYSYNEILRHYYPSSLLKQLYEQAD